jgi:hypothetical protein
MRACHRLDRLQISFDEPRLVADAGLLLPATLAARLGLRELIDGRVDLGRAPGRAQVGRKALTLIASLLAGGDCIADAGALRVGGTAAVLGHQVPAPSTLGTFLRSFTWGHTRQLDAVSREALARAWAAGAGPGGGPLTIDLDATLCETYGLAKAGARAVTYLGVRGYHPLLAVAAGTGELLHSRLREGRAAPGRGAASFLRETLARVRAAGATGPLAVRADAGFYQYDVLQACRHRGARFSITARLNAGPRQAIAAIPADAWAPLPSWPDGRAEVAATSYAVVGRKQRPIPVRLIVRRVQQALGQQLALFPTYSYHALVTDQDGDPARLDAEHRRHAEIEQAIRDLKYGLGLNHFPSGRFGANAAWLALNGLAYNLARWVGRLGLRTATVRTTKTLRRRCFSLPGRLTRSARRLHLHLPAAWPWAADFLLALARLRAIPPPLPA